MSLFIVNDNLKIERLLRRLLAIYARSIKRIKLKYFLQYYNNTVFHDYITYQKLNNMFKRKQIIYRTNPKNNNFRNTSNNYSYKTIYTPSQHSCFMNCSEPIIIKPSNNDNMAFLMTPCYIMDNHIIKYRNIYGRGKEPVNNMINNCYLTSRHKKENWENEFKNIDKDYLFKRIHFKENKNDFNTIKNKNQSFKKMNNFKKISFTNRKNKISKSNYKTKTFKKIDNKSKIKKINFNNKRLSSSKRFSHKKNSYDFLYNKEITEDDGIMNNNQKNSLCLGENNFVNNFKKKIFHKNKNKSSILNGNGSIKKNRKKDDLYKTNFNRNIFSYLYDNKYLNNLRKIDDVQNSKERKNNKKSNIFGIKTERRHNNKNGIFNGKDNKNNKNTNKIINDSYDYISHHSITNNRKSPYNKIIKNSIFSSSNFSLLEKRDNNKKYFGKGNPKFDKRVSFSNNLNNNSNSHSQSNNMNLNQSSTNYSIRAGKKDNLKMTKKKKERKDKNNFLPKNDEIFRDNQEKNTSNSNRISLQTLSDSKMMELAGHYGYEESSSENYQMNNVVHSKKQFLKKSK